MGRRRGISTGRRGVYFGRVTGGEWLGAEGEKAGWREGEGERKIERAINSVGIKFSNMTKISRATAESVRALR